MSIKRIIKNILLIFALVVLVISARTVLAQNFGIDEVDSSLGDVLGSGDPRVVASRIIKIALGFLGVIVLAIIIYAGFLWMTAGGEEEKIRKAKKILTGGIIGLIIILSSWAITNFILGKLGGTIGGLNPYTCTEGDTRACGCGGTMYCLPDGTWSGCIGSDCGGTSPEPITCSLEEGSCVPHDDICAEGKYCDNSCKCKPLGGVGDSCNINASGNICNPDDNLCGEYLTCDIDSCLCIGSPVITSISPVGGFCVDDNNQTCNIDSDCGSGECDLETPNGAVGNFITIFGQNFGEYHPDLSSVYFMGGAGVKGKNPAELNIACTNSWTDRQIIIAVPEGVSSGVIKVTRFDGKEDFSDDDFGPQIPDFLVNNIVRPGLCLLEPNTGQLNDELTYQGVNFHSGKAYFGNYYNNIEALNSVFDQSGYFGVANVPNIQTGETTSFVVSNINNNNQASNFLRFTKEAEPQAGPYINSFSPQRGSAGQYVTIFGDGFGNFRGSAKVYFGDVEAEYNFPPVCANSVWSNQQIIVKVPKNLANNNYFIKIELQNGEIIDTQSLNPNTFEANSALSLKTSLCKIEPSRGSVATPVAIYGEYFGNKGSNALVRFNNNKDTEAVIKKENKADLVNTLVPAEAITGPVKVIKGAEWGNELNFNIGFCRVNSDCGEQICCPANTYKQGRCVDTLFDCLLDIPNSVYEWRFNTPYDPGNGSGPEEEDDICLEIDNFDDCSIKEGCCFDFTENYCMSGKKIESGGEAGYCAYYNCDDDNVGHCVPEDQVSLTGVYQNYQLCETKCKLPGLASGPGKLCNSRREEFTCNFEICNYPAMACITEEGEVATGISDCGACCCQTSNPEQCADISPDLYCKADQGLCTGAGRGLCCGCENDGQCGNIFNTGCGNDTCCYARPDVASSTPPNGTKNVCRNAVIMVTFDQLMSSYTWSDNILLVQEMPENSGVCPPGTFAHNLDKVNNNRLTLLTKVKLAIVNILNSLLGNNQTVWAQFAQPPPDTYSARAPREGSLYCSIPINISGEQIINEQSSYSVVSITPVSLLEPGANYYLIIKGDEQLNSQLGVLNTYGVGMNGKGLKIGATYHEGENYDFNNKVYANSHIIQFSTLADDEENSGVCALEHVLIRPNSYLFTTNLNDLNENDNDANHYSFDTVGDRDKVATALAYSSDYQVIHPVTGYFWRWDFSIENEQIATLKKTVNNLPANKIMVVAKEGITDGKTRLKAEVNMDAFIGTTANGSPSCVCSGDTCPERCRNAYSIGNKKENLADFYIFVCQNPWPPQRANGTWYPWRDTCEGAVGGDCSDYNYSFYYCRDAGQAGTYDDLPAISPIAVTRGQSSNLVCSSNGEACDNINERCGLDRNYDGIPDGVCIWNILKESYFFRSEGASNVVIIDLSDFGDGHRAEIKWHSTSANVNLFKIYFAEQGRSLNNSVEIKINSNHCISYEGQYVCIYTFNNLDTNKTYDFQISSLTANRAESALSNLMSVTITDQRQPLVPYNFRYNFKDENTIRFSWEYIMSGDEFGATKYYRLYRGVYTGVYGEYFEIDGDVTSVDISLDKLTPGQNYFALSRVGFNNIESDKTSEIIINTEEELTEE